MGWWTIFGCGFISWFGRMMVLISKVTIVGFGLCLRSAQCLIGFGRLFRSMPNIPMFLKPLTDGPSCMFWLVEKLMIAWIFTNCFDSGLFEVLLSCRHHFLRPTSIGFGALLVLRTLAVSYDSEYEEVDFEVDLNTWERLVVGKWLFSRKLVYWQYDLLENLLSCKLHDSFSAIVQDWQEKYELQTKLSWNS